MAPVEGSFILAEEFFDRGDPRFVETLRSVSEPKQLAPFAARWFHDPRPWSRQAMVDYLQQPWNCPGHQPLYRRLFKYSEAAGDDELMGLFLVAFDRLVRRVRRWRSTWNRETGRTQSEEVLVTPLNKLPYRLRGRMRSPLTGQEISLPRKLQDARPFNYRSRYYLRRRVWRYFRHTAWQKPERYVPSLCRSLALFRDEDLARGEHLLDSRSLMQACFRHHPALEFGTAKIWLRPDFQLADLSPAPQFLELWQAEDAAGPLLQLLAGAQSRVVRIWSLTILQQQHLPTLPTAPLSHLLPLLEHSDPDVQAFAVSLLEASRHLETLNVGDWFALLRTPHLTVLEAICRLMDRMLPRDRLSLADIFELATAEASPVARMGLNRLRERRQELETQRSFLARLAHARCEAMGAQLAEFALDSFAQFDRYDRDVVLLFLDSRLKSMRQAAWNWMRNTPAAVNDPVLWRRTLETPDDDLRFEIIKELQRRSKLTSMSATSIGVESLTPVWASLLSGVHRGSRRKPTAVRQLARAIIEQPALNEALLPVLSFAVRSIRRTESAEGLSALLEIREARPELAGAIEREFPELQIPDSAVPSSS